MRYLRQDHRRVRRTMTGTRALTVALVAACLAVGPAEAQIRSDGSDGRAETLERIHELRSLQHRVLRLSRLATEETPGLGQRLESLYRTLETALRDVDPAAGDRLERLKRNRAELEQAWEARDETRVEALLSEQRDLRRSLEPALAATLRRPEIVKARNDLRAAMLAAMRKRDPELDDVLDRIATLADPWIAAADDDESLALWLNEGRE